MKKISKYQPSRALKYGPFSKIVKPSSFAHLDGRTSFAKTVASLRKGLVDDLGGTISVQENFLVDRIISKVLQASALELRLLQGQEENRPFYISLTNSLRLDLLAVGLERRFHEVTDLQEYIAKKQAEDDEK